jgi:hypothetical protein
MNRFRAFLLILCFCFFMVSLFSETLISLPPDHDCHGQDCSVCLLIGQAEIFLRQLKNAMFQTGFPAVMALLGASLLKRTFFLVIPMSAVRLKVKINR